MFQKNGKLYIAAECIYTTFDWLLDLRLNNKSKPLKHTTTRVKIKNFKLIFFNNSFLRYKSKYPLRKTYSYSEFFWSVFSRIQIEYRETQSISPYSARMRENMDQENFEHRHFLRSAVSYRFQKKKKKNQNLHLKIGKTSHDRSHRELHYLIWLYHSILPRQGKLSDASFMLSPA